jgi:hypothetical protein
MEPNKQKLAVDIRSAAEMLSVSPRTLQNYLRTKVLRARKIGRRTVIAIRDLETFLRTDHASPPARKSFLESSDPSRRSRDAE